jgi:hypothetical protein
MELLLLWPLAGVELVDQVILVCLQLAQQATELQQDGLLSLVALVQVHKIGVHL